ncbi:ArsR/SmtB family transcription factor [Methanobrevibacter sp. DSM 116169]|uniref:ArsR/SmtB family transcription factor n=1 Tax=Methanobrevibacter sp. DSM 116169 TaxID=3242727 RepID=UPI0038FC76B6
MTEKDVCEIKNIRSDLVNKISSEIEPHDVMHEVSDLFKILSNCTRVRILLALSYDELCVCELSLLLNISQSSISHQLRHLRASNLVKYRKENKQIFYSIADLQIISIIKEGIVNVKQ